MEIAYAQGQPYTVAPSLHDYAGILVCLARQEWPDLSGYNDPEVVYRVDKKHHAGPVSYTHLDVYKRQRRGC